MKKTIFFILILAILIISSTMCIEPPQAKAAVIGPLTHYWVGFIQTSFDVAMPNNLIVQSKDADNNTVMAAGTVTITCSDPKAILPTTTINLLDTGVGSAIVYFGTPGTQTITVTNATNSAITGTITVTVSPIHFNIAVTPTTITAGESVNVTVTALDYQDNVLTNLGNQGYGAAIEFSSTDTQAVLPAQGSQSRLISGTRVFNITLNTAGSQTITATNRDFNLVKVTSQIITVNAPATPTPSTSPTPTPEESTPTPAESPTGTPANTSTQSPIQEPTDETQPLQTTNDAMQTLLIAAALAAIITIIIVVLLTLKKTGKLPRSKKSANLPPPPPPPQ
ncbi:MAG: hypothetical protein NWE98_03640 [Candidatus Bathyarchaeota archaeon]|nr:hypothetical protein [Candidatus Bathyarchaeota archaeon]